MNDQVDPRDPQEQEQLRSELARRDAARRGPRERAMSLGGVVVELPELPDPPSQEEDDALTAGRRAVEGGGLLERLLRRPDLGRTFGAVEHALEAARARLVELDRLGDEVLHLLGRAWLDAGAPGRPEMKEQIELHLDAERERYEQSFAHLMGERVEVLDALERRDDVLSGERERLLARSVRLEGWVDLCDLGLQMMDTQGLFRALDYLEQLPEPVKRGIPRQDLEELRGWARELRERMSEELVRLQVREARASTRRARTARQGVAADARLLDQVGELQQSQAQLSDELGAFLIGVGKRLAPHASSLGNGAEAAAAIAGLRGLRADTVERVDELENVREALATVGRR